MSQIKIIQINPERWSEFKVLRLMALKLEPNAFGEDLSEISDKPDEYWQKELKSKYRKYFFAEIDKILVGMGMVKYNAMKKFSHITHFSGIFVMPEYRGMGVASALYKERIKDTFANSKIKKIKLIVNKLQKPAINLYKKFGFQIVGTLKKEFKIGRKYFDAYLMEKVR